MATIAEKPQLAKATEKVRREPIGNVSMTAERATVTCICGTKYVPRRYFLTKHDGTKMVRITRCPTCDMRRDNGYVCSGRYAPTENVVRANGIQRIDDTGLYGFI